MKEFAKNQVARILRRKAKQLLKKHNPKIVAVVGSVGKSSTKLAIAHVLSANYKVLAHKSSYNTDIGLPLSLFNLETPASLTSLRAWRSIFKKADTMIKGKYPYEVVVIEIGTDRPGDIAPFMRYIHPDIAVVTAVTPEHMELFKTLESVAKEELLITKYAGLSLINFQSVQTKYVRKYAGGNLQFYGVNSNQYYDFKPSSYRFGKGFTGALILANKSIAGVRVGLTGLHNLSSAVVAAAVGSTLGMDNAKIKKQLSTLVPMSGRMNVLAGQNGSYIIDDSYNSSPEAVKAALTTLYNASSAGKKIAILGSMNELGKSSAKLHRQIGEVCQKEQLNLLVTIGAEAAKYLAPAAKARGVKVISFEDPYQAGQYVLKSLSPGDIVLVKGSQNGVFAEEAAKQLLKNPKDKQKLVRQSPSWLAIKRRQFGK